MQGKLPGGQQGQNRLHGARLTPGRLQASCSADPVLADAATGREGLSEPGPCVIPPHRALLRAVTLPHSGPSSLPVS